MDILFSFLGDPPLNLIDAACWAFWRETGKEEEERGGEKETTY